MSNTTVAQRYAVALFQIAKEQNLLVQFEEELRTVRTVFSQNSELQGFLSHPKITIDQKKQFIQSVFGGASAGVQNTLMLLVERHRENIIPEVAEDFIHLANEERGEAEAKVYSVRPLTDDERQAINSAFAKRVGKQSLIIENIIDRTLLGGVKIRIGNRIFDGSVSGKLQRLEKQLLV
ncbi:F0F1 ATP synthase subunit delta [Peribacillus deserti]|uniref:ATP synthase subunit delta n=1 Tax=Peribacillus deserti TaxID=673318 RepID=A0A2N5MBG5_9BACI|nr:F0F1 ATP synthase subunit delta [Peribacillus deserti]PLT31700.1 F0F1 ATP synthase subunit delta [Peribacillus deserti]